VVTDGDVVVPRRSPSEPCEEVAVGYRGSMKLLRSVAALGIAKKLYDEARKPQNQAKIRSAIDRARSQRKPPRH
jgi:hypothetical protein